MKRTRLFRFALLAGLSLTSVGAIAQPREPPPPWQDPAGPPTDMDVWLRRLVGAYTFEGLINVVRKGDCPGFCEGIKGKADCVAIGTGPGVQCMLNVSWQDMHEIVQPSDTERGGVYSLPGGVSYLDPAMALFGLEPGTPAIRYLLVDNKGLPEGNAGTSNGNRGTFRTACVNAPILLAAMKPPAPGEAQWRTCDRIIRIDAKPDAKVVFMTIDIEINEDVFTRITMSMRRVEQTG